MNDFTATTSDATTATTSTAANRLAHQSKCCPDGRITIAPASEYDANVGSITDR